MSFNETEQELYQRLLPIYQQTKARPYNAFAKIWNGIAENKPGSNAGTALKLALEGLGIDTRPPLRTNDGAQEYDDIIAGEAAYQKVQEG